MYGNSFVLMRRWRPQRICSVSTRMSVTEDGSKGSIDRLRDMQKSVMERRRKARGISTSSTPPENAALPSEVKLPKIDKSSTKDAMAPPKSEAKLPSTRKTKTVHVRKKQTIRDMPKVLKSDTPNNGAMDIDVERQLVPGLAKLKVSAAKNGVPALQWERRKTSVVSPEPNIEVVSTPIDFGQELSFNDIKTLIKPSPSSTSEYKLCRRDGSLPLLVNESNIPAASTSSDPLFVVMPSLDEFTARVPFEKSEWFLPRVNGFQPILSDPSKAVPVQPPPADLSDDCKEILRSLNSQQSTAVTAPINKACLVLAGPGSGKTRVLTHRAAYLCRRYKLPPYRILAVTFTNKAAGEMKNRLRQLLDEGSDTQIYGRSDFVVGTFHSICARILRTHGEAIGIKSDFHICDASDCRTIIAGILRKKESIENRSTSVSSAANLLAKQISRLKNHEVDEMRKLFPPHVFSRMNEFRISYDAELRKMNQLDFDDLLLETRKLLETDPDSLKELQRRYQHILVDEWQDTNIVQFDIVSRLAEEHKNIFVVGDDDQAIFKFRGADVRNLNRFAERFPDRQEIHLEKNYRSTGCIVNAAQGVIERNRNRPGKVMHTTNPFGAPIVICNANDDRTEAWYVVKSIQKMVREQKIESLSDVAVLYRTNVQSRAIEEACIRASMRYRIIGGTRFYDRQEVKDVMSYVRLLVNPADDIAALRAINTPNRGIGAKTIETLKETADRKQCSILFALQDLVATEGSGDAQQPSDTAMRKNAVKKLQEFYSLVQKLRSIMESISQDDSDGSAAELIAEILSLTDYKTFLEKRTKSEDPTGTLNKFEERWANIVELEGAAARHSTLGEFMESVALLALGSDDPKDENQASLPPDAITLLTLHSCKGLEYDAVFVVGAEESVLPLIRNHDPDSKEEKDAIDEERRLAFVGMTRAKKYLSISHRSRVFNFGRNGGFWRDVKPSRFLEDIPKNLVSYLRTNSSKTQQTTRRNITYYS